MAARASGEAKQALVLGVNGQDGSYLAEALLDRGYTVTGVARQARSRWVDPSRFDYRQLDACDAAALDQLLAEKMPSHLFHMAAVHGSAGFEYESVWGRALALNVGAVHTCLEHIRRRDKTARLFYPSSLKVFGDPPPAIVDEATPRQSTCLYSITKNAATDLIHQYRMRHGAWACVGYFFNHDSPRRPDSYFLPRLARKIAASMRQGEDGPNIATLDFWCDWGSSQEFMGIVADLVEQDVPSDVVLATGVSVYAADLARDLAASVGAPTPELPARKAATPTVQARLNGMRQAVGRTPRQNGLDVARWIFQELQAPANPEVKQLVRH